MTRPSPGLLEPAASPVVAEYLAALATASDSEAPLVTAIHPDDEMYLYELSLGGRGPDAAAIQYFATGEAISRNVLDALAWRFGEAPLRVLDFAAGRGRTTRFLARRIDPSRITVAEIDSDAVDFQREAFGVAGLVSTPDPDGFAPEGRWDAVLACSFFSHLPHGRFERWVARLFSLVAPGGMLLFSVHAMGLLPPEERDDAAGILFRASSENPRLDAAEYGTSFVTPEYVARSAAPAVDAGGRLLRFSHGLCGYQDLYALLARPLPSGAAPSLARHPLGALERSAIEGGRVRLEGWAEGGGDERAPDVRLVFGNAVAGASSADAVAGPRREWRFEFSVADVGPDELVRVEAVSERGLARILVMGTLRPYLPADSSR